MSEEIKEETMFFYEPNYLNTMGLSNENALEYFSISHFYDKSCINEIIKMQTQFTKINVEEHMQRMQGIFYEVEKTTMPNIFVIMKKERENENVFILKVYYIICGYIYCCPTIEMLSESKLCEILWIVNKMLDFYEENKNIELFKGIYHKEEEKNNTAITALDTTFLLDSIKEFVYKSNSK